MQRTEAKYKNMFDCTLKIIKNEGVKGLYKGIFVNFVKVVP